MKQISKSEKNNLVLVLGMPRSGTSLITRSIHSLGLNLSPKLWPANKINPTGFFEDIDFVEFNTKLLNDPNIYIESGLIRKDKFNSFYKKHAPIAKKLILKKVLQEKVCLIKDPRFTTLILFYKKIFDELKIDISYIVCIRHPFAVAKSNQLAGGVDTHLSYYLWLSKYINILTTLEKDKKLIIDYESFLKHPKKYLARLAIFLNVYPALNAKPADDFLNTFIDKNLNHTKLIKVIENDHIYQRACSLYRYLKKASLKPDAKLFYNEDIKNIIEEFYYINLTNKAIFTQLIKYKSQVNILYASRSWKATYPLRYLMRILKYFF
jgi:hypothetical protein